MALTPSTMLPLGTLAPDFALPGTDGNTVRRADFEDMPLLVLFICNHCPYVKHVAPQLKQIGDDYGQRVAVVAINSNDVDAQPDDAPEQMKREKRDRGYDFPYLFDATQETAKAYTAACTPDVFLFDRDHALVYRGQLDDTRPNRVRSGVYESAGHESTGVDLRAALDAVLQGEDVPTKQHPSVGCNIKWKPGHEPDYA